MIIKNLNWSTTMLKKKLLIISLLVSIITFGQNEISQNPEVISDEIHQNCEQKVKEVYQKIISSIGNNFPAPPNLVITKSKKSPATISSNKIFIEEKYIFHLCSDPNFEDKLSYVIAHELAHHYLDHTMMYGIGLSYASSFDQFIDEKSSSQEEISEIKKLMVINQRKACEEAADKYAGFYGQIAGYNTLEHAKSALGEIYALYSLKNEIKGYPSYSERLEIIDSKFNEAKNLSKLFHLGNIMLRLGEYDLAKQCFEDIIQNKFISREIYNNLGTVYLLYGISLSKEISKFQYPIFIDYQTRAEVEATRSGSLLNNDPKELINKARELFKTARTLDAEYLPSVQNLYVIDLIDNINNKKERKKILSQIYKSDISNLYKIDFEILNDLLNGKNKKKLLNKISDGSNTSEENLSDKKINLDKEWLKKNDINDPFEFMGISMPFEKITTSNRSLKIKEKLHDEYSIYEINENNNSLYLIKIHPSKIDDFELNNYEYIRYKSDLYLKFRP